MHRAILPLAFATGVVLAFAASAALAGPVGNRSVPQPAQPVDLARYIGRWHEIGRYENSFERGMEGVTAEYRMRDDGLVDVINSGRKGGLDAPLKTSVGRAKILKDSGQAKLKVSFFGPFFVGDYWVLDHDPDYQWSIVGEPSGRYLWLLAREANPPALVRERLWARAHDLGYDTRMIRPTLQ
jgi:apolipoprotein D and lipocalin family protein